MPEIATSPGTIFYRAPRSVVYTSTKLREADFVEVPYLHCELLNIVAAPEIDTARLVYEYGTILREDGTDYEPFQKLDIVGKFVKVEIVDTVLDESEEPIASIVWYGKIEAETTDVLGTRNEIPTGVQYFTAFGLLRLAERTPLTESLVEDPSNSAEEITIQHALPFNQDTGGIFVRRGNRSNAEHGDFYVFSPEPRSSAVWDAYEAVRYLLANYAPKDSNGLDANTWRLHADVLPAWLDWYDIAVDCNDRSLKSVLDALIDRRRGVGYRLVFNTDDDAVELKVFTFVDADVTLPSGKVLTANPDTYTLDFESSLDVDATVSTVGTTQFNKVIARGALRTTTFSAKLLRTEGASPYPAFIPDWTSSEETEFRKGASLAPGYDDLDSDGKLRANALWRASDRLRNVFARWKLNPTWDKLPRDVIENDATDWLFCPEIPTDADTDADPVEGDNRPVWLNGVRFLRGLPFLDRYDYSGTQIDDVTYGLGFSSSEQPEFIPPFAFLRTAKAGTSPVEYEYEHLDKLSLTTVTGDNERRWSSTFHLPDTEPAIELRTAPQQMLALYEWQNGETPAASPEEHDPTKAAGVDWANIRVTICAELNEHVEAIESLGETPGSNIPLGKLVIEVPDARFDYVVPFTVVELKNGEAIQTLTGGAVRDDRKRLRSIAKCAAEWYGRNRQTLDLTYKQVRGLFDIGQLITSVGANYSLTDINTVITSITYQLDSTSTLPMTNVRTSFGDLDVQ